MSLVASKIAGAAFFALFPAFYFYHFAVAEGLFLPFLAGWHGPMTAIFVGPLLLAFAFFMAKHRLSIFGDPMTCFAVLFLLYATGWMLVNFALLPRHPAHEELATALLSLGVYFLAGAVLDPRATRWWLIPCWIVMLILALAYVAIGAGMLMTSLETEAGSPLYQGLARSMMLVSMVVVALQRAVVLRVSFAVVSVIALFVIGARSELYGFLVAFCMAEFLANRRSVFGLAILGAAGLAMLFFVMTYLDFLGMSRQMLVFDLGADRSWQVRQYFNELAAMQILDNPLFGIYGGHWDIQEGGYAHNALSAWVSLGLVGFVLYIGLCVGAVWRSFSAIIADPHSPMARLGVMIALAALLLIIVAKPVFWAVPALAWGLNTRAFRKHETVVHVPVLKSIFRRGLPSSA